MTAHVSCIIPVFNGARYLRETLDSVVRQTHPPAEIIVVDDGSTDDSVAVARQFGSRVTVISQANAGHAAARNRGIAAARGEFVAFVDADDLWTDEKIERQLARFAARPELGASFAHLQNFWSPEVAEAERSGGDDVTRPVPGYSSVTMLARRELFTTTVGPLDETLSHGNDRDWFCRAAEKGVVLEMLPEVLVHRRLHATNRSSALGATSRSEYLRILKASLDRRRSAGGESVPQYPFGSRRDGGA